METPIIDPAQKICIMLSHPCDKNKNVARMGHPISVANDKGRISKFDSTSNIPAGVKQAVEKGLYPIKNPEKHPQGLKPVIYFQ